MTLATIVLSSSFLIASVADALPPKYGTAASAAVLITGQLGRALYQLASRPVNELVDVTVQNQPVVQAPAETTGDSSDGI